MPVISIISVNGHPYKIANLDNTGYTGNKGHMAMGAQYISHYSCLIFVILFTQAGFSKSKIPKKNTPKRVRYAVFRVKSGIFSNPTDL